jgi:MFS family permease
MARPDEFRLPVHQLSILALCKLAETVAPASLDPYLPEMIESFGISTKSVAKYAGMAGACYSISQCLTAVIWGRMSDRFGRKYLLLASLCGVMITSVLLGLSKSVVGFISVKILSGAGSGSASIIATMVAEMVPQKKLRPKAFAIMPFVWMLSVIIGPAVGGLFVQPARKYPNTFGEGSIFRKYPFLLPPLAISIIFLVGIVLGFLFLKETLKARKSKPDQGLQLGNRLLSFCYGRLRVTKRYNFYEESAPCLLEEPLHQTTPVTPIPIASGLSHYRNILTPQSTLNLLVYTLLVMHCQGFEQLLPVLLHHPIQEISSTEVHLPFKFAGGFGMSSGEIGLRYTLYGISGIFIQVFAFPAITKRFGVLNCMKTVIVLFPVIYIISPFATLASTGFGKNAAIFIGMLLYNCLGIFAFPCSDMLLTGSASSSSILGTLIGLSTGGAAIGGAIGSVIGGTFFSSGVSRGYIVDPFWALAVVAAVAAVPVFYLEESEQQGKVDIALGNLEIEDSDRLIEERLSNYQNVKIT